MKQGRRSGSYSSGKYKMFTGGYYVPVAYSVPCTLKAFKGYLKLNAS